MSEDYVTTVAEEPDKALWIGYRHSGWQSVDLATRRCSVSMFPMDGRAIAVVGPNEAFVGRALRYWRNGVLEAVSGAPRSNQLAFADCGPLPPPASPATATGFRLMDEQLRKLAADQVTQQRTIVALADDWRTQGNWVGRYGRYWACLAAMVWNFDPNDPAKQYGADYVWRPAPTTVPYAAVMGTHHAEGDSLRYWICANYDKARQGLEMPSIYFDSRLKKKLTTNPAMNRRPAFWNDNGEAYPANFDGPHMYCTIQVPAGWFYLSLYQMGGPTSLMDLVVSIRSHDVGTSLDDVSSFWKEPELVHARFNEYGNGCYKRFLVHGPSELTVGLLRNYSFNSNLDSIMLDMTDEFPPPYFGSWKDGEATNVSASETKAGFATSHLVPANSTRAAADRFFEDLTAAETASPAITPNVRQFYLLLARFYKVATQTSDDRRAIAALASSYYHLGLYEEWESCLHQLGMNTARDIDKSLRWDGVTNTYLGKATRVIESAARQSGNQSSR